MNNINDIYFEGHYKEIWRSIIPEELTRREIDFMLAYFNLQPGSRVLDLMCGYGRHALGLARKGMQVTAIDNLDAYTNEVKDLAMTEQLPVKVVCADVLDYQPAEKADLVICMGNSLNFFNARDTVKILGTVSSSLATGGRLLINTWSLAEIAIKTFNARSWTQIGELRCLNESKFLFHPARVETETVIIDTDGTEEKKTAIDYIFSVNEMESMLKEAGLKLQEMYSVPGKKSFTIGEPRAYLIAGKK